jgi:peptidoglycan/xylan/chitin deacetylase (PgdA/CDA1 family)
MHNPFSWGRWRPVIHRQPHGVNEIALTFDDGPHPETTPAILDLLQQYSCTATFFFSGVRASQYRDLVRLCVDAGHAVYGHGWDHVDLTYASDLDVLETMRRTERVLRECRPTPDVYLVRLPYNVGCKRPRFHEVARRFHHDARFAWWTITTLDWVLADGGVDSAELTRRYAAVAREIGELPNLPGAILLLHEAPYEVHGHPREIRVLLSGILDALVRRGLRAGPIAVNAPQSLLDRFLLWRPGADVRIRSLPPDTDFSLLSRARRKFLASIAQ